MSDIFISYRRSDSSGHAGRLRDRLRQWFAEEQLFYDRDTLRSGEVFTEAIDEAIRKACVVLVVIGPEWLNEENRERLHKDNDVVRREIALSLSLFDANRAPVVIPLLCGGAVMPTEERLPEDLRPLCEHHAHVLDENSYAASFSKLRERLAVLGLPSSYRSSGGGEQPFHTNGQMVSPYFADPLQKLDTLYQTLHKGSTALVMTSVHGMGGVGKTQLALKYSYEFRDEYDGVWWFRAEDTLHLEEDCQELCAELKIPRHGEEVFNASVRRWLKGSVGRWLLVYDNADKPADIRKLLPESGKHHILFTSRSPHWKGMVKGDQMVPMETWTDEQALEFLRPRLPDTSDNILRRLSFILGGLPLALEQACAYIERTGLPIEIYCQQVDERKEFLDAPAPDTGYPHSVLVTLSLAFDQLSEPAKQLLRLCAWCAPEPIPYLLFRAPAKIVQEIELKAVSSEEQEELLSLLPFELCQIATNDVGWCELVAEVTDFALAQAGTVDLTPLGQDARQVDGCLLLHRLTQAVVIHKISEAATDIATVTKLLRATFPSEVDQPPSWPLARGLMPHVLKLEEHLTTGHVPHRPLSWLLDRVGMYLKHGPAIYEQAVTILRRVLKFDKNKLGENSLQTLRGMNSLALVLKEIGDLQGARKLEEQVLLRVKELLGPDHPDTLASMQNLASTLWTFGDLHGARKLQEQLLDFRINLFGPDHPETLTLINDLASTLWAMGDHQGARKLEEQVLNRCQNLLGPDHLATLTSMNNLASTLGSLGDHQGARRLEEQVLDRCQELLGPNHPMTLASINNLAGTLSSMGDHQGARKLHEQTIEHRRKLLGLEHPHTTISAWNLLATLIELGETSAARILVKQDLSWLLADGVELHNAGQRQVRDMLLDLPWLLNG